MRVVRVKISKAVLPQFFIETEGRCFGVHKGLPIGSKLLSFKYHQFDDTFTATFTHESFDDIEPGASVPWKEVQYMAYQIAPKEEVEETADAA